MGRVVGKERGVGGCWVGESRATVLGVWLSTSPRTALSVWFWDRVRCGEWGVGFLGRPWGWSCWCAGPCRWVVWGGIEIPPRLNKTGGKWCWLGWWVFCGLGWGGGGVVLGLCVFWVLVGVVWGFLLGVALSAAGASMVAGGLLRRAGYRAGNFLVVWWVVGWGAARGARARRMTAANQENATVRDCRYSFPGSPGTP